MRKTSAWPLAQAYAALIVYASLYPFSGWRNQGMAHWEYLLAGWPKYWSGFDLVANVTGYVPLGFLLALGFLRRGGLAALPSFGPPESVQLMVLIDRRFSRALPIQPDYVGKWVDSIDGQRVKVEWKGSDAADRVLLYTADEREVTKPSSRATSPDA